LADIHADPENFSLKLAYAEGLFDLWGDPRGQLIQAQEGFRLSPEDQEANTGCLAIAAHILGAEAKEHVIMDRLWLLLSERYHRSFEADCAQRVLWVFEAARPRDTRPRLAIQGCREFVLRLIGIEELHGRSGAAGDAASGVDEPAWSAAFAAAAAASFGVPNSGSAVESSSLAVLCVAGQKANDAESRWQVGRMIDLWLYGWDYPLPPSERHALGDPERKGIGRK
jgi:hypothetical protein